MRLSQLTHKLDTNQHIIVKEYNQRPYRILARGNITSIKKNDTLNDALVREIYCFDSTMIINVMLPKKV